MDLGVIEVEDAVEDGPGVQGGKCAEGAVLCALPGEGFGVVAAAGGGGGFVESIGSSQVFDHEVAGDVDGQGESLADGEECAFDGGVVLELADAEGEEIESEAVGLDFALDVEHLKFGGGCGDDFGALGGADVVEFFAVFFADVFEEFDDAGGIDQGIEGEVGLFAQEIEEVSACCAQECAALAGVGDLLGFEEEAKGEELTCFLAVEEIVKQALRGEQGFEQRA